MSTPFTNPSSIKIDGLDLRLGSRHILKNLGFKIPLNGTVIGLLGPNGAGKSSLLKCLTGFERSYTGNIHLEQEDLTPLSPSQRTLLGIGYLPQESWLFKDMSVRENLELFYELLSAHDRIQPCRISEVIDEMGLNKVSGSKAKVLSGGEKRRLEFARTLLLDPVLFLLDEPFSGVDPKTISEILHIVQRLTTKGVTVLISDHHADHILRHSSWVHMVHEGQVIESGPPEKIRTSERVKDIYLGYDF